MLRWHSAVKVRSELPWLTMNLPISMMSSTAKPTMMRSMPRSGQLDAHGIQNGIIADLGYGTGELTLMLTQAGYDMIGIDQSEQMLCVVQDKAQQLGLSQELLLLRQDLCSWISMERSRRRCLPLTHSTTCRIWIKPLPMLAFLWKRRRAPV